MKAYQSLICIVGSVAFIFLCCTNPNASSQSREAGALLQKPNAAPFKDFLGINAFEWDFLQNPADPNNGLAIFEPKMALIQSFGGVRHYLDWTKIEPQRGIYTFNPTASGGWNLDVIYQRCKASGIDVLVCLKTCPEWLLSTYPANERDNENVPIPYGADKSHPASYLDQAKAGFQLAARYGSTRVDTSLLTVSRKPRWTNDPVNMAKTGLGLIKYIECDNERDKWWKGNKARQSAAEYAANLSAFYDGDQGRLGKAVGVKAADPNMKVVMAGLAAPDVHFVEEMINWCKDHRGFQKDGRINLCFDIINYHLYANDHLSHHDQQGKVGVAPELSEAAKVADDFVALGNKYKLDVWVTESGYDINDKSPQRAIGIGDKSAMITQADWTIRTALLYARHSIRKNFFYMLYDDNLQSPTQYASSGFVNNNLSRRPVINYVSQVKNLMGDYHYSRTVSESPLVDVYEHANRKMYVLVNPEQQGHIVDYVLALPHCKQVAVHKLNANGPMTISQPVVVKNGQLKIKVSETPTFIEPLNR
ncbi:hypothetical protein [Mucilaginibacter sp. CSA2-8R]|uniref:hypothetical protein n=1 Tax=Mucilaginibacter sp. CSA2-8R TaxID=3141542 RepID=UPI00315D38FB